MTTPATFKPPTDGAIEKRAADETSEALELRSVTPMDLLQIALTKDAAIDVIERIAALQEKERARIDLTEFNEALTRVQEKIKRIAPDLTNTQTHSKYASYAQIDRKIRPIYSAEGFSLSFTHAESNKADHIRVIARLSLRAHVELYQMDMPVDPKGPKGNDVMTMVHATGSSDAYAKRYLVKDIFNIAIGEEDDDGNLASNGELTERLEWIASAKDPEELKKLYGQTYREFEANPAALKVIIAAKKARLAELGVQP